MPKHPISIKNFVHCGALQSRRAISGLFSFFLYTLYVSSVTGGGGGGGDHQATENHGEPCRKFTWPTTDLQKIGRLLECDQRYTVICLYVILVGGIYIR